eukprot:TRINITY_DN15519_c0_g1_i1.p1 TRINITY_DN15519_c0_g1~~TRINITY_DN15519_c0_g1_i1.p1  ORF type:complete len:495 (+),score=79.20 TRINITY_DN15519_c0_g1_i1:57-1541(+)
MRRQAYRNGYYNASRNDSASGKHARADILDAQWLDDTTFKVEAEESGVTDGSIKDWISFMDKELDAHFDGARPQLLATMVNLSRNDITDEGVQMLMLFFQRHRISVEKLKFFRNAVGDVGATAIGRFIGEADSPLHELHLSHNWISEKGVLELFRLVAESERYPCVMRGTNYTYGKRESPLWIRLEQNCVEWRSVEDWLYNQRIQWCTSASRDSWHPKHRPPTICLHDTYNRVRERKPHVDPNYWGQNYDHIEESTANGKRQESKAIVEDADVIDQLMVVAPHAFSKPSLTGSSVDVAVQLISKSSTFDDGDAVVERWRRHLESTENPEREVARIGHMCEVLRKSGFLSPSQSYSDNIGKGRYIECSMDQPTGPEASASSTEVGDTMSVHAAATSGESTNEQTPAEVQGDSNIELQLLGALMDSSTIAHDAVAPSPIEHSMASSSALAADEHPAIYAADSSDAKSDLVPTQQKKKKGSNKMNCALYADSNRFGD